MSGSLLIVFARNPDLGKVKSRLARTIGSERALAVYKLLLNRTAEICDGVKANKVVYYSDRIEPEDIWSRRGFAQRLQGKGDLGMKMLDAFHAAFEEGFSKVVIIGSDCFELTSDIVNQAFKNLDQVDVVMGPAHDGGYYLLGMKELHSQFFINKNWSTNSVLKDTISDLEKLGLNLRMLTLLNDVDVEDDLKGLEILLGELPDGE